MDHHDNRSNRPAPIHASAVSNNGSAHHPQQDDQTQQLPAGIFLDQKEISKSSFHRPEPPKSPFHPFELNSEPTFSGGLSWSLRVPTWLKSPTRHRAADRSFGDSDMVYYGGSMEPHRTNGSDSTSSNQSTQQQQQQSTLFRVLSNLTRSSQPKEHHEDDSIADFHESEWTPQDSSYGAACPVCGWIPKGYRQLIEATLIGLMVLVLVYVVVTSSMRVSDARHNKQNETAVSTNSEYDGGVVLEDDFYIENSYDGDQRGNDDDDRYNRFLY